MQNFNIPTKSEVTENNQQIFDKLETALGFVPNLYAYYAKSDTALGDYLTFQDRKTSLSKKEKEVINLVVSQNSKCTYCLSAHTVIGGLNGFSNEQILELREGRASFDSKLDALAKFTLAIAQRHGKLTKEEKESFFNAGFSEENLVDVSIAVGTKLISNFIHNAADFAIDFPLAPKLEATIA